MSRGVSLTAAGATLACLLTGACSLPDAREASFRKLVRTEREFSRAARTHGMKVAFLRYLDDDAVLFRPHPVNGKEHTALQPESGIELSWEPVRADVAAAGDLGWTTGPYTVAPGAPGEPPLHGYFLSVWKLQQTRRWKVILDLGTENPPGERCHEPPALEVPDVVPPGKAPDAAAAELAALEQELGARPVADRLAAYAPFLRDDTRLYRDGRCPAIDPDAVRQLLAEPAGAVTWVPMERSVAASGDLAFSYGSYAIDASQPASGYYVRVWRDDGEGWRLAAEITSPVPADDAGGGG